jgi:hypothetical protein
VQASLLPLVDGEPHAARTRCPRSKATSVQALEAVRAACDPHGSPPRRSPQVLGDWHAWATDRGIPLPRASSAVEGRNGSLAPLQPTHRGLPKRRSKVWTVRHHCECHAADGTTPAARLFRRAFPDLFDTVFSTIADLPRPRHRNQALGLTG